MKLVYFRRGEKLCPGIDNGGGIIDVEGWLAAKGLTLAGGSGERNISLDDLSLLRDIEADAAGFLLDAGELSFGPCVVRPSKIICIGLNYRQHAIESGMAIPTIPVVFTKYNNTLVDYEGEVSLGPVGEQFDYEVELGVVIGKKCKHVATGDALDHVLGYCVANDLSCRDLQFRTSQWLMGKSLDHFLPLGKWLVTADEVGDPQNLGLRCSLNGALRQDSNTADMIFSVAEIIADLSKHMTLEAGDLIVTGTPQGVIMGLPPVDGSGRPREWLKPGDVVEVEIEGLGATRNKMVR